MGALAYDSEIIIRLIEVVYPQKLLQTLSNAEIIALCKQLETLRQSHDHIFDGICNETIQRLTTGGNDHKNLAHQVLFCLAKMHASD